LKFGEEIGVMTEYKTHTYIWRKSQENLFVQFMYANNKNLKHGQNNLRVILPVKT
jgi:hypothetical protein